MMDTPEVNVPIFQFPNGTGKIIAKDDLIDLRRQVLDKFKNLLSRPYEPSPDLYNDIQDDKPWWTVPGFYFAGRQESIPDGVPAEEIGIVNPLILVRPEFIGGISIWGGLQWNREKISKQDILSQSSFPFRPLPESLKWFPPKREAEVSYNLSEYLRQIEELILQPLEPSAIQFDAVSYNAYDLGLNFIALNTNESINIKDPRPSQFGPTMYAFRFSKSRCGNSEGCNGTSILFPSLQRLSVASLPAKAVFYLFDEAPTADTIGKPDWKFIINLK